MSADQPQIHQCLSCDARFSNAEQLWNHVHHVDCKNNGASFPIGQTYLSHADSASILSPVQTSTSNPENIQSAHDNGQDSFACGICDIQFNTSSELGEHTRNPAHREKLSTLAQLYNSGSNIAKPTSINVAPSAPLYCHECQVPIPCQSAMESHIAGKKHQKILARINEENAVQSPILKKSSSPENPLSAPVQQETEQDSFFCEYCRVKLTNRETALSHLNSGSHRVAMAKLNDLSNLSPIPMSNESIINNTEASNNLPTFGNNPIQSNELNYLLRRLCLTQLLFLLYKFDESQNGVVGSPIQPQLPTIGGIESQELLRLIRAVCHEEFQNLLPAFLQSFKTNIQ